MGTRQSARIRLVDILSVEVHGPTCRRECVLQVAADTFRLTVVATASASPWTNDKPT
ncbi:MAG: hypothetical protein QGH65_19145 [SAR324 cluster bacterium]|nr:hypothetical protein [SAR324 cluster bacterium]